MKTGVIFVCWSCWEDTASKEYLKGCLLELKSGFDRVSFDKKLKRQTACFGGMLASRQLPKNWRKLGEYERASRGAAGNEAERVPAVNTSC